MIIIWWAITIVAMICIWLSLGRIIWNFIKFCTGKRNEVFGSFDTLDAITIISIISLLVAIRINTQ